MTAEEEARRLMRELALARVAEEIEGYEEEAEWAAYPDGARRMREGAARWRAVGEAVERLTA